MSTLPIPSKPGDGPAGGISIRRATPKDRQTAIDLYINGNLGSPSYDDETVTPEDVADIAVGYLSEPTSKLWIAEADGGVAVGMVGLWERDEQVAELRRLRVHTGHRGRGIGSRLMETALAYCREQDYLKIVLDTYIDRGPAISLFEKFGFTLTRTRQQDGKDLLDFYLDLYRDSGR